MEVHLDPVPRSIMGQGFKPSPGFYILTNTANGKFYIGSTNSMRKRINHHRGHLKGGVHENDKWQAAFTTWETVAIWWEYTPSVEHAKLREQQLLDQMFSDPLCCNLAANAYGGRTPGFTAPAETRVRMATAQTGKVHSEATKIKIGLANSGKCASEETRLKMRNSRLGVAQPSRQKPVSIDGVVYTSLKEAVEKLGMAQSTIQARISGKIKGYPNWSFLRPQEETS